MKVLKHFDRINNANHILYRLKKGEWSNLIGKLPVEFRQCYITDKVLKEISKERGSTKSKFLAK